MTKLTYAEVGAGTILFSSLGNCPSLETLIIRSVTPPEVNYWTLRNSKIPYIYVPDTSVDAYKSASGWSAWAAYINPLSSYKK